MQKNLIIFTSLIIWIVVIAFGYKILINYEFKPTSALESIQEFPQESQFTLDPKLATLFIFIHPHCPCSRASIEELSKLLAGFQNKLKVIAIFTKPKGVNASWIKTDLWHKVKSLPNVEMFIDYENHEAKIFKANSSGEVFLFKPNGNLVFHGGITSSRGHEGDNKGRSTISHYLSTGEIKDKQTFTFGCIL